MNGTKTSGSTILFRLTKITTWYLEMTAPHELRPVGRPAELEIRQAKVPCPELNRFLYTAVGGDWYWVDRLPWSYAQWLAWVDRPALETWVANVEGNPIGYFELEQQADHQVEIAYFGLLPQFVGRGYGGALLTATIERAWQLRPQRVWVHTCSLDHPSALANYQKRGFRLFKEEVQEQRLPERTPGPWPGARP